MKEEYFLWEKKGKGRIVVSGLVKKVNPINKFFSFVTIDPFEKGIINMIIPVYMKLEKKYEGRFVDIINKRKGLFGNSFEQTIQSSNTSNSVEMPYSSYKRINEGIKEMGI